MSDIKFVNNYLKDFSSLLQPNENIVNKIISVRDVLISAKKNKKLFKNRKIAKTRISIGIFQK